MRGIENLEASMKYIIILVFANFAWAASYAAAKLGMVVMLPVGMVFFRISIGAALLLLFSKIQLCGWNFSKAELMKLVVSGLCLALAHMLWMIGINMSRATDASLLYAFEPVWGIVLARLFLKEKIRLINIFAVILAIVGLIRLSDFSFIQMSFSDPKIALGNLLITIATLIEVGFTIVIQPIAKKHPPEQVAGISLGTTALFLAPLFVYQRAWDVQWDMKTLMVILYLGIICSAFGYAVWVKTMKHVKVGIMYFTLFLQPLLGPFVAYLLLGESLNKRILESGAFLLAAMAIVIAPYFRKKEEISNLKFQISNS